MFIDCLIFKFETTLSSLFFLFFVFLTGFFLGIYLCIHSVESSGFIDCGNGYMVHVPLACPEIGAKF